MVSPVGPLLQALAKRILANLDTIDKLAPRPGEPDEDRAPYSDTQLLVSLLGVLVFPHERAPDELGELLQGYKPLGDVVKIRYSHLGRPVERIEVCGSDGERDVINPSSIKSLPKLLRNSIAHFNVLPLEENGRFSGVRVWNKDEAGNVTLVADLAFDQLRSLARHILDALARASRSLKLDDPEDPLDGSGELKKEFTQRSEPKKPPRVTDTLWERLAKGCNGDKNWAKEEMDQAIKERADLITRVRRKRNNSD
jgi:hypothetical protein